MQFVKLNGKEIIPSKIVCVGRNYVEHIEELNNEIPTEPVIFIKPNSAISSEVYSNQDDHIHYEGEICFLIQSNSLFAVGFGLDLTKRKLQTKLKSKGLPWEKAKSFDKSAVFSEFVIFAGDIQNLNMELYLNNKRVQKAGYDLMLNKPVEILNEIHHFLTLEDGDLIMSGTPKGVGVLKAGDTLRGKIYEQQNLLIEASWRVL